MLYIDYGFLWLLVEFLVFWENSIFKRSKGDKKVWLMVSLSDFKFWKYNLKFFVFVYFLKNN